MFRIGGVYYIKRDGFDLVIMDSTEKCTDVNSVEKEKQNIPTTINERLDDGVPMSIVDICDKILGVIYGGVIGDIVSQDKGFGCLSFNAKQLLMTVTTYSSSDGFSLSVFTERLRSLVLGENGGDAYTTDVVSHVDFVKDPGQESLRVFKTYNNYDVENAGTHNKELHESTAGGAPLIRAAFLGIFANWDNYTVGQCLVTHYDARVISASYIAASFIRSMMLGRTTVIQEIMESAMYTLMTLERINNEFVINDMMRVLIPPILFDLPRHNDISSVDDSALKCLSAGIWSLNNIINGKCEGDAADAVRGRVTNALESVRGNGGSSVQNCGFAGAIMGGEVGYKNLPLELLSRLSASEAENVRTASEGLLRMLNLLGSSETIEGVLSLNNATPGDAASDPPCLASGERLVDVDEPIQRTDPVPLETIQGAVED